MLPEGSRERFTAQASRYLDKMAERIDQQRVQETKDPTRVKTLAGVRSPVSEQAQPAAGPAIPIDQMAELRRQQTEMLERLAQERGQSRDRERGHEAGD